MKKILPPLMLMALCGELLNAKPVSEHEAKNVALNYIHKKAKNSTKTKIKKFKVKKISADEKLLKKLFNEKGFEVDEPTFRLIELEPYGWVLVSGDDVNEPIIGYSLKENQKFDINSLPPQLEEILERYSIYTKEDREKNKTDKVNNEWNKLNKDTDEFESELNEETTDATTITYWKLTKDVDITTPLWNQDNYYNELTPPDSKVSSQYDGHVPTGCAATVVAILTRYHSWPNRAVNLTSYTDNSADSNENGVYGLIPVQYNNHLYSWNSMPMGDLTSSNDEIAILMHHAGVAERMDYGPLGSGTPTENTYNAFVNNFRYRSYGLIDKSSYSNIYDWYQKIKTDLRQGYPVVYRGYNTGGHIFLIDGFDVDGNEFQINWGWGGVANGMFRLSNLTPLNYNFNSSQRAILGLKPNNLTDIYENDNTWETSSYMSKGGLDGRKNGHSINPVNDVDWINFWTPTTQTVTIETLNSIGDTRIWLYDQYGQEVAYNENGGSGNLSKITTVLPGGTYYIKVGGNGNNTISSYDIQIR